ncbi:type VI secretion system protein IglI family protein [Myxococcus landrumensis]|uniref:ImpA N-terminal domain-containing protein n=1 Tax=Myxococcus landrumensis TaxID=2813577 RepID=A0ABX7NFT0_9BACT|nr:type VI secretion system protein IglI family protein [Myxococcus landrumus]QSQ16450.1 hypothetical protein JY572_10550 [Myxococcus landrumus]
MADAALSVPPYDGTYLEEPLEGTPPEASSDGEPDPRVEAVTEAVAGGDYATAARSAEALLREGMHDTRLVGPYLFGSFQEQGLFAMPGLFRSLLQVLTVSRDAFGPVAKRDIFLESGLRWLLRSVIKHIAHHEKKQDATWKRWCEADNREPIEEALPLAEPLLATLPGALPKNGCEEPFRNLAHWLRRHLETLPAPAPPAPVAPPTAAPTAARPEPKPDEVPAAKPEAAPRATMTAAPTPSVPGVPVSAPLALLIRKLEAFDRLVQEGAMPKAGVVAADVMATVERFDPRVYLPSLFTRFFAGLTSHAHSLEPYLHESESLPMRALEQLYRVDLDAFLALPSGEPSGEED